MTPTFCPWYKAAPQRKPLSTLKSYFSSRVIAQLSPSNTATQNRDILIPALKSGRDEKKTVYVTGNSDCPLGRISITGLTDNATTISLGAGQKLHIEVDDSTVLLNQLNEICLEVDLSDNTVEVTPTSLAAVYGTNTAYPTASANPFYAGEYLAIGALDASIFSKYGMVKECIANRVKSLLVPCRLTG